MATAEGISELEPQEADAFVRLDTGYFDLELCRGTAQGTGSSKWGIRHFRSLAEDTDLLPSGNNAIGGFYGPFFTPENGLINPPEHTTVDIEVVERGPVLHHYRMHGTVPDGLLEELKGKTFTIDWWFTHGTPYFQRVYRVDDFQTVINGRSITNKITVGDEFEGGQGDSVFDRFEAYDGTRIDPGTRTPSSSSRWSKKHSRLQRPAQRSTTKFRRQLTDGMDSAHWDLYWRLFCSWEEALRGDEIRERLGRVRKAVTRTRRPARAVVEDAGPPVDVSSVQPRDDLPRTRPPRPPSSTENSSGPWSGGPHAVRRLPDRPAAAIRLGQLGHQRRERVPRTPRRCRHQDRLRGPREPVATGRCSA